MQTISMSEKQDLRGEVVRVHGRDDPLLVVGYQERRHKVYNLRDMATEVLTELKHGEFSLVENKNLVFPVGQRVVVFWDGAYGEDDMVTEKLPYEAYVVQHRRGSIYRLLYTADDTLEDRDLSEKREQSEQLNGWRLVDNQVWDVNELQIVSWSERPPLLVPVVDYSAL